MTNYLYGQPLWAQVEAVTQSALAIGALKPIPTRCENRQVNHDGTVLSFQIRVVENSAQKTREMTQRAAQTPTSKRFSPFQPYDANLYVGELTKHYRCLLNKFNVMHHHILMVTTHFTSQRAPLNPEDFLAALICLQAKDGLVFYNGGSEAGASVEHKHLQMIPRPRLPATVFPEAAWFSQLSLSKGTISQAKLPFPHRTTRTVYPSEISKITSRECAEDNWQAYQQLLNALNLSPAEDGLMPPHNMLMTREHLWVVPRTRASYQGLAVNALGFAGTFLVKSEAQRQQLDQVGCMELLKAVSL